MKHRAARPLLAAIALAWGTPVLAADGGWNYRIVPYVWGASIDGTLAHDRLPVDVHPSGSFSDIWNNLDFAAMAAFEAQRDRHGVVAELVTLRLSGTARMPIPPLGASVPVELDGDSTTVLLAYQYRMVDAAHAHLDLVAGARYWSTRTGFAYALPAPPPPPVPQSYDASQSRSWIDPQLGIKGRRDFAHSVYVGAWLLAGAGESDLTVDAMLMAGYRFNDLVAPTAGYRWMTTDFSSGGFTFDATLQGPGLGLEYAF